MLVIKYVYCPTKQFICTRSINIHLTVLNSTTAPLEMSQLPSNTDMPDQLSEERKAVADLRDKIEALESRFTNLTAEYEVVKSKAHQLDLFLNDVVFRALNVFSVFTMMLDITTVQEDGKFVISCQCKRNNQSVKVIVSDTGLQVIDTKEYTEKFPLVKLKEALEHAVCVIDEELLEIEDGDYEDVDANEQVDNVSAEYHDDHADYNEDDGEDEGNDHNQASSRSESPSNNNDNDRDEDYRSDEDDDGEPSTEVQDC